MKKITLLAAVVAFMGASEMMAQTYMAISPIAEGGFEVGDTFDANGWSVANGTSATSKLWQIGTGQPGFTGVRTAFIGNSATNPGNTNGNRRVHLYRSITIPADATNIVLKFKYKQEIVNLTDGVPADYLAVSFMEGTPVSGSAPTGTFMDFIPGASTPTYTEMTGTLPASALGTTKNLVFTFRAISNTALTQHALGAIDDIELTYDSATMSVSDFNAKKIAVYPNPVKDILNLSAVENIDSVGVYNLFGQNILNKKINATEGNVDMSGLATGTYIVNVQSENNVKTIKVVK